MFSKNSRIALRFYAALFCVFGCAALVFNFAAAGAQTKRFDAFGQNLGGAPIVTATLTDTFPDPDGNGRAAAGEEVTYTATIANNGDTDALSADFTTTIDENSTFVPGSVQVLLDVNSYAIRCTFDIGGSGGCSSSSALYAETDAGLNTIIGGQASYLNLTSSNPTYDAGTEIFQFDATVQNLISNSLGTLDNVTPDAAGIRVFLQNSRVISGTGSVSIANAEGTATFTAPNQPYFQYSEILQQNEVSGAKTIQVIVPSTVNTFTVEFLVSTKAQVKVVINEVLANPGGTISDANGEWFELYNAGQFPVKLKDFLINDFANTNAGGCTTFPCERPSHLIASDLIISSGGYAVLGNTINTTNNGGVPVDYAYGSALALVNSQDGVRVQTPVALGALTLNQAIYLDAATSSQNGISRELINPELGNSNIDGSNWANASVTAVYGPGGRGTPKAQNSTFTPFAELSAGKNSAGKTFVDEASAIKNFAPVVKNAGETVTADLETITPGGFATVTYRVTVANPIPVAITQIKDQATISGDNFGDVLTNDPSTPAANDETVTPVGFAPSAASVTIGGQVLDPDGRAVSGARVSFVDSAQTTRTARTNPFGYFIFEGVAAGQTIVLNASSKRYQFSPQVINVTEDMLELSFTANP